MPAKTEKQRKMMAIAEHHPEKLYKRNREVLKMGKEKLSHFAKKHHSADDGAFLASRRKRFKV